MTSEWRSECREEISPFDHFEGGGAELSMFNRNKASGLGSGEQGEREDEARERGRGWVSEGRTGHREDSAVHSCCREKSLSALCRKGMQADVIKTFNLAAVERIDKGDKCGGGRDPSVSVDEVVMVKVGDGQCRYLLSSNLSGFSIDWL